MLETLWWIAMICWIGCALGYFISLFVEVFREKKWHKEYFLIGMFVFVGLLILSLILN